MSKLTPPLFLPFKQCYPIKFWSRNIGTPESRFYKFYRRHVFGVKNNKSINFLYSHQIRFLYSSYSHRDKISYSHRDKIPKVHPNFTCNMYKSGIFRHICARLYTYAFLSQIYLSKCFLILRINSYNYRMKQSAVCFLFSCVNAYLSKMADFFVCFVSYLRIKALKLTVNHKLL